MVVAIPVSWGELFDKLTSLPLSFHAQSRSGDVVTRVTN